MSITECHIFEDALILGDIDLQAFVNTVKNFRVLLLLAQLHIFCLIKNCVAFSWSFGSYRSSIIFGLRKTYIKITEFFHKKKCTAVTSLIFI